MLKHVLLATGMIVAGPALAQTTTTAPQTTTGQAPATAYPATPQTSTQATPQAQTAPQAATQADPMTSSTAPAAPATAQATPATPAQPATQTAAQPASGSTQVASIVDAEFGTYDKNADGKLDEAEFTAWMVALKTKSDPSTNPNSPETKKWMTAAFNQADADKNQGLSKAELTGFLSQGQG